MRRRTRQQAPDPWSAFDEISLVDPAELDPQLQRLQALGWLRTEINNGGLHQYFQNTSGDSAELAIDASLQSGVPELADLLREAASLLGTQYPADRDQRLGVMDDMGDELWDALDPLDEAYFNFEATVDLDAAMQFFL